MAHCKTFPRLQFFLEKTYFCRRKNDSPPGYVVCKIIHKQKEVMELVLGLTVLQRDTVIGRETKEGWPLLTVETEVNGESKSTNERGPSWAGSSAFSCRYKRLLSCLGCSSRASTRYFFSSPYTISIQFCPQRAVKTESRSMHAFGDCGHDGWLCIHLVYNRFNSSWKLLAAGQLLSVQGRRYSVRPIHHSISHTCRVKVPI